MNIINVNLSKFKSPRESGIANVQLLPIHLHTSLPILHLSRWIIVEIAQESGIPAPVNSVSLSHCRYCLIFPLLSSLSLCSLLFSLLFPFALTCLSSSPLFSPLISLFLSSFLFLNILFSPPFPLLVPYTNSLSLFTDPIDILLNRPCQYFEFIF